jgi:cobalt/nickel transport system permease protein
MTNMDPSLHVLDLPLGFLILTLSAVALVWIIGFLLFRVLSPQKKQVDNEKERDWSLPAVDSQASRDSLFHRWDPRIKVVSLLFFMFCVAFLNQLVLACIAVVSAVISVIVARIPFRYPLRRLAAMAAFLGMFLVVMPLTAPARSGDTVVIFGRLSFLAFNVRGFLLALLISLKASAIALMVEPLLATSPFSVTIQALADLKVPPMVCQMILLAHRYIFVFQHESRRMATGMDARGFRKKTDVDTLRTIGNFLGMLLVRSFERTQRVYDAMLSRGYRGALQGGVEFHARKSDWAKGAFWIAAGVIIFTFDRCWKV